jgi:hypothetical protein
MNWHKDKWLLSTIVFAFLMWLEFHERNTGSAMIASWFCGRHFTLWVAIQGNSGGDTALREKPL